MRSRDFAVFCRQFAFLLQAGLPLVKALELAGNGSDRLQEATRLLAARVQSGHSLARSMREQSDVFPPTFVGLIEVGEGSGALVGVVEKLAQLEEKQLGLRQKIQSALVYPAFLIFAFLASALLFAVFVFPPMRQLFESMGLELPLATRVVLAVGTVLSHPLVALQLVVLPVVGVAVAPQVKAWLGEGEFRRSWDRFVVRSVVFGPLVRRVASTQLLYVLICALSSGLTFDQALRLAARATGNSLVAEQLRLALVRLEAGGSMEDSLAVCEVLQGPALDLVGAGEHTGRIVPMAGMACRLYEMEIDSALVQLTALIEPVIMAVMGLVTGFLFIASVLPTIRILTAL